MPALGNKNQSDSYSDELLLQQILTNLKNLLEEELAIPFYPPVPPQTRERNSTTTTQQMNEYVNEAKQPEPSLHSHSASITTSLAQNHRHGTALLQNEGGFEVSGSTPQASNLQTRVGIGSFELGNSGGSTQSMLVPQTPAKEQFRHNFHHTYDSDYD